MKKWVGFLLALFLTTALGSAAQANRSAQGKGSSGKNSQAKTENTGAPQPPAAGSEDPSYVIGPEDVLNISVWKEPEVTRTVPVRPDGMISLPLLNDVQAVGLTPTQLAAQITEKLRKFLTEPQVTVIVTAINSRRIYITGEVGRGGTVPLLQNMTVLEALAGAGFTPFAHLSKIYVLRTEGGKRIKIPFNYKDVVKGHKPEQDIFLKPGDTIVVP